MHKMLLLARSGGHMVMHTVTHIATHNHVLRVTVQDHAFVHLASIVPRLPA